MPQNRDQTAQSENPQECTLEKGLAGLEQAAIELGARSLAVLVVESASVEMAYPKARAIHCDTEIRCALSSSGVIAAGTPPARFLADIVAPESESFLLFPWCANSRVVIIVFGFTGPQPTHASVPDRVVDRLNLAALAAWSVTEANRLRKELRVVNHQLANRKLVERAKSMLQTERGLTEPEAYELLRKMSRQRRVTIVKLAEDLVCAARCP
jgi:hypothetical protein